MNIEPVGIKIDFKGLDGVEVDEKDLDRNLLKMYPMGFMRNCSAGEKIMVMQRMERCPTHCLVKPGVRLYLELDKAEFYPEDP